MISLGNLYSYHDEQAELARKARKQRLLQKIRLIIWKQNTHRDKATSPRQILKVKEQPVKPAHPPKLECCRGGVT